MAGSKKKGKRKMGGECYASKMLRRGRVGRFEMEQGVRLCFFQPNPSCCKLELVRCSVALKCAAFTCAPAHS